MGYQQLHEAKFVQKGDYGIAGVVPVHRRLQTPLRHLRAATNAVLGSLTGKTGAWRDKRRCKTCEEVMKEF